MVNEVVLLSGGIDSAVCLALSIENDATVHCVIVDYGQSHSVETLAALDLARFYGVSSRVVTIGPGAFGGLGVAGVYEGGAGVVPGRNAVLISLALAAAEQVGATDVVIGCNADDAADYPDCRFAFLGAWGELSRIRVNAPLIRMTKRQVVAEARRLGVPIDRTVSCYRGTGCGECNACKLRASALEVA
jgi:7-cyano-7-deazaguanine synthase